MTNEGLYDPFDVIALFNTLLGIMNYGKNTAQHEEQESMQSKLDLILAKLNTLEGGTKVGENKNDTHGEGAEKL